MLKLWIAGLVAVGLFLAAMFWPQPHCKAVTWYAFGNAVTVEHCE